MTALSWPERVAAVKHDGDCRVIHIGPRGYPPCTCSRDARIGRKIEAALHGGMWCAITHGHLPDDAAAARAFEEASGQG